ncbi:phage tail protein [Kribbella pratensis]|uniref:Phage tail-like protein n=1 Tax=Kribbella pratensis TaxID=2512112 RepID=A0A4R8CM76_9ACTN|nr:phage tail protein [Kribbella pratensis]TDW77143.1 phage tail-like protein [Kribbella pratensis]
MTERSVSAITTCDQWVRGRHDATAVERVDGAGVALTLTWQDATPQPWDPGTTCAVRGSAVDRLCRVYRLDRRSVARLTIGDAGGGLDYARLPAEVEIVGAPDDPPTGADFVPRPEPALLDGAGIAIDEDDRLFLADRGRRELVVLDLWSRRLLRRIPIASAAAPQRHPIGLAARGRDVVCVVAEPAGLLSLSAHRGPRALPLPATLQATPARATITASGDAITLWHDSSGHSWLVGGRRTPLPVDGACELVSLGDTVVLAPAAAASDGKASLHRVDVSESGWIRSQPLDAFGYDGRGIVAVAGDRIGYWTAHGLRLAVPGKVTYARSGGWLSYRFDSGQPGNRWGRIFLDACVPEGTSLRVATLSSDDDYETALSEVLPDPADCLPVAATNEQPLPPATITPGTPVPLHQRSDEPSPWWRLPAGSTYAVHEAPVVAAPGRYLWVALALAGNTRSTPSVRAVRIERQSHTLARRLPAVLIGDAAQAEFLERFLGLFDGFLYDLQARSDRRDLLVDPASTPVEALPWLASFVGLLLDDRWAEAARRQLIAEVVTLYRRRGTLGSLQRYLEIYLAGDLAADRSRPGLSPVLIEHYRLRGLGPDLGADPVGSGRSVLGAGLRVGTPSDAARTSAPDSSAHRFTVVIPRPLDAEQQAAVRQVLDTERPAHTAYDLCTVDAGMRLGRGLHLALTSVIGPTGGLRPAYVGAGATDRDLILGGPTTGLAVEGSRLDRGARVG